MSKGLDSTYYGIDSVRWRAYSDNRTWRQRTQRERANWDPILPSITAAYLRWRYTPTQPPPQPTGSSVDFDIGVIDIYTLEWSAHIPRGEGSESPLEALALSGYLGNKPLNPSLAISIRTLELYRRLRLRKPSFSVEAFAKVVCDLYSVSLTTTTLPSEYKLIVFRFHINEAIAQHWGMHLMCILLYYEVWISKLHRRSVATRPTGESSMRVLRAHTRFVGVEWTTKQSLIYIFSLKMNPHAPSVV